MRPEWPPLAEPAAQWAWVQVLVPIAAEMRASAAELAERAVARVLTELPHLFPDEPARREALVSTEASLQQLAELIGVGGDPRATELPPSTQAIARTAVQRQVALADLMRFYRLAQELVWTWLFTRITAGSDGAAQQADAVELATGWVFGYVDAAQMRAEQTFELERESWLRGAAAARAAAIEDILAHRELDPQRASKRLRYDVARMHVAVMAWMDAAPDDADPQALLGSVIAGLARDIAAESTLIHPSGSLGVVAWLSRRRPFTAAEFGQLGVGVRPADIQVALGDSAQGLRGFRRTHIEAAHARRVASMAGPRAAAVTRYRDVAVAALASVDREQALSFVTRVLGPLAAHDEDTFRLATTLTVYLEENRSRGRTARRLTVHPNTVSYRVHQAEAILGRAIDTDTIDLAVALALLPALPGLAHAEPAGL